MPSANPHFLHGSDGSGRSQHAQRFVGCCCNTRRFFPSAHAPAVLGGLTPVFSSTQWPSGEAGGSRNQRASPARRGNGRPEVEIARLGCCTTRRFRTAGDPRGGRDILGVAKRPPHPSGRSTDPRASLIDRSRAACAGSRVATAAACSRGKRGATGRARLRGIGGRGQYHVGRKRVAEGARRAVAVRGWCRQVEEERPAIGIHLQVPPCTPVTSTCTRS